MLSISSSKQPRFYAVRNTFNLDKSPEFRMTDREVSENYEHQMIVSYPMYLEYSGLSSAKDLLYEELAIMLKDP